MTRKIQFKRGLKANLPRLSPAELAFTTDEKKAYIGDGNENIRLLDQKDKTELTTQLAEKVTQIELRNAQIPLDLKTYENKNQGTHPKVLYFENKWNGYNYWMAFTPFGDSNDLHENPSILASNDGIKWEEPAGLINPIDTAPNAERFFSDTHLLINEKNELECWYRQMYKDLEPEQELIWRKKSKDGINWGEKELLIQVDSRERRELLSPSVFIENGVYKIWVIGRNQNNTSFEIKYYESATGADWKYIRSLNTPSLSELYYWHLDVTKTDLGYEMLLCAGPFSDYILRLYHMISYDNISTTKAKLLIDVGKKGAFDDEQIYRSCLLKIGTTYHVYYSASSKGKWKIALSTSTIKDDIFSIRGMSVSAKNAMLKDTSIIEEFGGVKVQHLAIGDSSYLSKEKLKLLKFNDSYFVLAPINLDGIGAGATFTNNTGEVISLKIKNLVANSIALEKNQLNEKGLKLTKAGVSDNYINPGDTHGEIKIGTTPNDSLGSIRLSRIKLSTDERGVIRLEKNVEYDVLLFNDNGTEKKINSVNYFPTAQRPTSPYNGYQYFDTTLGKLLIRHSGKWVDAMGNTVT